MSRLALIFICLFAGLALQKAPALPQNAAKSLNFYVVYVALPALILFNAPNIRFEASALLPAAAVWLVFGLSYLFFTLLSRFMDMDDKTRACLTLVCGLGNTSFLGFPVLEYFFGKAGLELGVLAEQPGSFFILSTLGIAYAVHQSGGKSSVSGTIKKIASFPPVLVFAAAILIKVVGVHIPVWLSDSLGALALTMSPVGLVSIGLQTRMDFGGGDFKYFAAGLFYKLLLAPVIVFALLVFSGAGGLPFQIAVIQSAMPPMITAALLAETHGLNPALANRLAGWGIGAAFFGLWFWGWAVG